MYLTRNGTYSRNPDNAVKFSGLKPKDMPRGLSLFSYRGSQIAGKTTELTKNPPNPNDVLNGKKFALKCKSIMEDPSYAKQVLINTPVRDSNYERSLVWLASKFTEGRVHLEDCGENSKLTEYLSNFHKYKSKLRIKNLNDYGSPVDLFYATQSFTKISPLSKVNPYEIEDVELIYEGDEGSIWTPKTPEASCAIGKSTEWCTAKYAPSDKRNMWRMYAGHPLYVWFDKATGERLQYHAAGSMNNESDEVELNNEFLLALSKLGLLTRLELTDFKKNILLPEGLRLKGALILRRSSIEELPESMTVMHDIDCSYSAIKKIPSSLIVHGSLYLNNSKILNLPKNLNVGNNLYIRDTDIYLIPDGLSCETLQAEDTKITKINTNTNIKSWCLTNSPLKEVPDNFNANALHIGGTDVVKLPKGLNVGSLDISSTDVRIIPKDAIFDSLDASNTMIRKLPNNMNLYSLVLTYTQIEQLPKRLYVKTYLKLEGTQITELPKDLRVDGQVYLPNHDVFIPKTAKIGAAIKPSKY